MIMSMILFTLKIQIAKSALDVHLSDLKIPKNGEIMLKEKNPDLNLHQRHLATDRRHNPSFLVQLSSRPLCAAFASRDR